MGDDQQDQKTQGRQQADAGSLLAWIAAYERESRVLRGGWDAAAYERTGQLFEQLREQALRLPLVQAEWVAVLISRFEFTDALWKQRSQQVSGARLHEVHELHTAALRRLRLACARAYGVPPG